MGFWFHTIYECLGDHHVFVAIFEYPTVSGEALLDLGLLVLRVSVSGFKERRCSTQESASFPFGLRGDLCLLVDVHGYRHGFQK